MRSIAHLIALTTFACAAAYSQTPAAPPISPPQSQSIVLKIPKLQTNTHPARPKGPLSTDAAGVVEASVDLTSDGEIERTILMESSGDKQLDDAFLEWLSAAKFTPAHRGSEAVGWKAVGFRDFRVCFEWRLDGAGSVRTGVFSCTLR